MAGINVVNNHLLVTKPPDMDQGTNVGFREVERFVNTHPGLPAGGTSSQVLTKDSATNYDVSWQTPSAGGGIYPPPSIPSTGASYYWDSATGFYWASTGGSTERWKLATNQVHTSLYQNTATPMTTTASLFQWDTTPVDWMECWDMVYAYTYIFPINGYYLVSWKVEVTLSPGDSVSSWAQMRTGAGAWTTLISGNLAINTGSTDNTFVTSASKTLQVLTTNPPANTVYTVPTPYVQLQLMWQANTTAHDCSFGQDKTYMTIDLIGTIDQNS